MCASFDQRQKRSYCWRCNNELLMPQQLVSASCNALVQQAESSRNDGPFLAVALAAFVLPAAVILGIAASTGYLDKLAGGYGAGLR